MATKPTLNIDLLEKLESELKQWDVDNEDTRHFSIWRFVRFCVLSSIAPYMAEDPYLSIWKRMADGSSDKKLQLFPRAHFKSTTGKAYGAFLFCEPESHKWGPQVRLCVGGQTTPFATRTVNGIKRLIETNEFIRTNYPPIKATRTEVKALIARLEEEGVDVDPAAGMWTKGAFRTLQCIEGEARTGVVMEEPSCYAVGFDQNSTGFHFDVALIDDPVGRATANSPKKKKKARDMYYDLQSQMMDGLMIIFGTRWATDDIHSTLIEEYFDSIDINHSNVWGGGKEWYKEDFVREPETGKYKFLGDPDEITLFFEGAGCVAQEVRQGFRLPIQERREATIQYVANKMHSYPKSHWTKQMLNRAHDADDAVFRDEMFRFYDHMRNLDHLPHYVLTDSATGKDSRSSYRVVATVCLDERDNGYVRSVQYGRWGPEEYVQKIVADFERFRADRVLMEKVAWQSAFLSTMELVCRNQGRRNPRVEMVEGRSEISKFERIEALEPRLRAGKLLFNPEIANQESDNRNVWKEIKRQFIDCRDAETSRGMIMDVPDALSDIEACRKDGSRICRVARHTRGVVNKSYEEQLQSQFHKDRQIARGIQPKRNGRLRKPSSWR